MTTRHIRRRWATASSAVLAALAMSLGGLTATAAAAPADVDRLSGGDRYGTAQTIADRYHSAGVERVYVALGTDYPDALAGAPAAALDGAPVLLVHPTQVPEPTRTALERLRPQEIVILGGTGAISPAIATVLESYATTVTRMSGVNRFATSAQISQATYVPGVDRVYVANGMDYPDALAASPAAGADGAPILLIQQDTIPDEVRPELERLAPAEIVILGGSGAVDTSIEAALADYTTGSVTRLSGPDRYATSVAISQDAFPTDVDTVVLATGHDYPDALAGGPAAVAEGGPILLVQTAKLPDVVRDELVRLNPDHVVVLGGTGVISDAVAELAADPAQAPPVSTSPEAAAALAALDDIRVTTTEAAGYDRSEFGSGWWQRQGCNTRHTILQRDFIEFTVNDNCVVQTGILDDPYTGQRLTYSSSSPNSIQIDHIVPVSAAWKMGANTWSYEDRRTFYNDHENLLAVHGPTNASKSDKTLGEWQPPNQSFHCDYAITYIEVTDDWDLALKPIDVDYAEELLPAC